MQQQNHIKNQLISEQQQINLIEELLLCLNYPNTNAIFKKEKNKNNQNNTTYQDKVQGDDIQQKQQSKRQQVNNLDVIEKMVNQSQDNKEVSQVTKPWSLQQAKYYSKFATFSQLLTTLQQTSKSHSRNSGSNQQNNETPTDIIASKQNQKPVMLQLFSIYETVQKSQIKKYHIPIYKNLSIQSKFNKKIKFIQACIKENYVCIIDESNNFILCNLNDRSIVQIIKIQDVQTITAAVWLKSSTTFAFGTQTGKLHLYTLSSSNSSNIGSKNLQKLTTLSPHSSEITSLYCNKEYMYSSSTDNIICKLSIKFMKLQLKIKLKYCLPLKNIQKIQTKKLSPYLFGISSTNKQLLMIEQSTGNVNCIFSISNQHARETMKIFQGKQENVSKGFVAKYCWIREVLWNWVGECFLISTSGINPTIYQYDPITDDYTIRLTYRNLKLPLVNPSIFQAQSNVGCSHSSLSLLQNFTNSPYMSLSHKSQVLTISNGGNIVYFYRVKNWRLLYELTGDRGATYTGLSCTRRYMESDDKLFEEFKWPVDQLSAHLQPKTNAQQQSKQKLPILCLYNQQSNMVEVYYSYKMSQAKTIRSQNSRARPFLSNGIGLPSTAQGFLQLLQTIRENYHAFV